jgi:hypothetical protein
MMSRVVFFTGKHVSRMATKFPRGPMLCGSGPPTPAALQAFEQELRICDHLWKMQHHRNILAPSAVLLDESGLPEGVVYPLFEDGSLDTALGGLLKEVVVFSNFSLLCLSTCCCSRTAIACVDQT